MGKVRQLLKEAVINERKFARYAPVAEKILCFIAQPDVPNDIPKNDAPALFKRVQGETLQQVAEEMNVSRERVSQIEERALKRVDSYLPGIANRWKGVGNSIFDTIYVLSGEEERKLIREKVISLLEQDRNTFTDREYTLLYDRMIGTSQYTTCKTVNLDKSTVRYHLNNSFFKVGNLYPNLLKLILSYQISKKVHPADVKARKKAYFQKPDVKARKKAYYQKPDVKARQKAYQKAYLQKPDVKARKKAYQKAYLQRNKKQN